MPAAPPGLRIGVSNGAVPAAALAAIRPARSVAFLSGVPADHQARGEVKRHHRNQGGHLQRDGLRCLAELGSGNLEREGGPHHQGDLPGSSHLLALVVLASHFLVLSGVACGPPAGGLRRVRGGLLGRASEGGGDARGRGGRRPARAVLARPRGLGGGDARQYRRAPLSEPPRTRLPPATRKEYHMLWEICFWEYVQGILQEVCARVVLVGARLCKEVVQALW